MDNEQTTTDVVSENEDLSSMERGIARLLERESQDQTEIPEEKQNESAQDADDEEVINEEQPDSLEETEETEETEEVQEDQTEESKESEEESEDKVEAITTGFVEINGQNVDIEEVKLGYMRQADYTKKTQAVAEQRKQAETQTQNYESTLQALLTAANADISRFANVNWEQAAVENPEQYKQAKAMYDQTKQTHDFIKMQAENHTKQMEQRRQQEMRNQADESLSVLKATIPNWGNDLYNSIGEYANTLGVSREEFNEVTDHRLITALYKAQMYDKAKAKTTKKIKSSAKKTLSSNKAPETKVARDTKAEQEARARLRKSGKMDDAVNALNKLF
ncbi:MAG: putative scaffolding protein [Prokaryotic dsDNA virus sp.]|nr:MAG: putative scaffolding protein [Prokaryotic dsDNA virus sp.]|tara:strand:- start:5102 stop:6106 length:1005 start_codon:yes stop_codon:yes gene_type:complete